MCETALTGRRNSVPAASGEVRPVLTRRNPKHRPLKPASGAHRPVQCRAARALTRRIPPPSSGFINPRRPRAFPAPDLPPNLLLFHLFAWISESRRDSRVWLSFLNHVLKVLEFLLQRIRKGLLILIFFVPPVQHHKERVRGFRWLLIKSFHPERDSSVDHKPFASVSYLFLRPIGLSHL